MHSNVLNCVLQNPEKIFVVSSSLSNPYSVVKGLCLQTQLHTLPPLAVQLCTCTVVHLCTCADQCITGIKAEFDAQMQCWAFFFVHSIHFIEWRFFLSFIYFFMDFTVRELFHPGNKEKHVTHAQRSVFDRPIMMVSLRLENPVFHVCICKTISENF